MRRLFIVNHLSNRVARKGSVLDILADEMDIELHDLGQFKGLKSLVTQAAATDIEHIIIEGGDGTAQGVLSAFFDQKTAFKTFPKFSIVPGGMTNQVAKTLGLKSARLGYVRRALSKPLSQTQVPMLQVFETKGKKDGKHLTGFLFSTGAIPQITRYTTENLHKKGIGGSFAVLGGLLKAMRSQNEQIMPLTNIKLAALNMSDQALRHDGAHLGTVVTTLPSLILGIDPFWGTDKGPLRLTLVKGGYKHLARNIIGIWLGQKQKDRAKDGFSSTRAEGFDYIYDGPIVLDGEFLNFGSNQFSLRATAPVSFLR